jgi:hypothetical protein
MTKLLAQWDSPDGQVYSYQVAVSEDGANYTQVATRSGASSQTTDTFESYGRYLKVTISANGLSGNSAVWVKEFQVYGILTIPPTQNTPCDCDNPEGPGEGGPFNPRTGFLWTSATDLDLTVASSGPALAWSRTYVSHAITETTGPLGVGWQHPYHTRLITESMPGGEPGLLIVVAPNGNRWRFQESYDYGVQRSLPGIDQTLRRMFEVTWFPTIIYTTTFVLTTPD